MSNFRSFQVLGRAGTVKELLSTDCVKVEFSERAWAMNTKALKHIATEGMRCTLVDYYLRNYFSITHLSQIIS